MDKKRLKGLILFILLIFLVQGFVYYNFELLGTVKFQQFSTILLGVIMEALPFVLLGVIAASVIEVFVSESTLQRLIPKNKVLALLFACSIGIIFPVCECGIIPVMRKLIKKGVPVYVGLTMVLAVPIINPVGAMSTFFAFFGMPQFVAFRLLFGFVVAFSIGMVLSFMKQPELKQSNFRAVCPASGSSQNRAELFNRVLYHSIYELFEIGKFLIIGASLTALMHVFIPKSTLTALGFNPVASIAVMMILAFSLSLCSQADAFVAKTFLASFSPHSIMAFLIFGPIIDAKNTLMLMGVFKSRFVFKLVALMAAAVFLLIFVAQFLIPIL